MVAKLSAVEARAQDSDFGAKCSIQGLSRSNIHGIGTAGATIS